MGKQSTLFQAVFPLPDLGATEALGARIAGVLKKGDAVALAGDLGAGKTTLARAILAGLGVGEAVPSPTFTLVQSYGTARLNVSHFDLYRLKHAGELDELGLDEALEQGAALIEWPERAEGRLPPDRLTVALRGEKQERRASLSGPARWSELAERSPTDFLRRSGWGDAGVTPLAGDASTRRYARLTSAGKRALLMDQPQSAESPLAPEQAGEAERRALGYNALARLAGADTSRFQAVAEHLRGRGLAAPKIHAADHPSGFVILEDFGDTLFADVLADGASEEKLYSVAAEVLARLHAEPAPASLAPGMPLFVYDQAALLAETDLLTEWFLPLALHRPATEAECAEHRALWRAALDIIADHAKVLVHRDFHAQNLMWMPERAGLARVGLIDFQDAVAGSRAYDLISLIEDARRDVSPALAEMTTAHYLAAMKAQGTPLDEARFRTEMAVMAAQRNAKIVGIFARLYKRDGKPRYLALLPRVWGHLERDLMHPALAGLRAWYDRTIPREHRLPEAEKERL